MMDSLGHKSHKTVRRERAIVLPEANSSLPLKGIERMAKRRFQNPKPARHGKWWTLRVWRDTFENGEHKRNRERIRLAPANMSVNEVKKVASEYLRPMNQNLESIGSATNFKHYVESTYVPVVMPLMAKSTQERSTGVIKNYLIPAFGSKCLRDLTPLSLQAYFTGMVASPLSHESKDKIRDVLSSILGSALKFGLLVKNPMENVQMPPEKRGKRRRKPYVTPEQFEMIVDLIAEPYATMVYVAVYTGLRVSELIGLRWNDVLEGHITIDERCFRGDWGAPKSEASNATIPVNAAVIERIRRLKTLTVEVRAGCATRRYRVVKADGPNDLVFQSVRTGVAMRDNNILTRHIKPAGGKLELEFLNWRCLRTSHATWLKMAGADVKDAQAQMRHARASTTLDIYQQFTPESQRRAVDRLTSLTTILQ
jgi:integrase